MLTYAALNPLEDQNVLYAIFAFIKALTVAGVVLAIPLVMIAGFYFIYARGSESELKNAKAFAKKVFIGLVIILALGLAFKILLSILDTFKSVLL